MANFMYHMPGLPRSEALALLDAVSELGLWLREAKLRRFEHPQEM